MICELFLRRKWGDIGDIGVDVAASVRSFHFAGSLKQPSRPPPFLLPDYRSVGAGRNNQHTRQIAKGHSEMRVPLPEVLGSSELVCPALALDQRNDASPLFSKSFVKNRAS